MPDPAALQGYLIASIAALSLAGFVAAVGVVIADRTSLRTKLREIDDLYALVNIRDQELMLTAKDRLAAPVFRILTKLGRRLSPAGYVAQVRNNMLRAGRLDPAAADRFLAMRSITLLAAPIVTVLLYSATASVGGIVRLAAPCLGLFACVKLPSMRLARAVETRERLILRQMPDLLDLLVICVEAGLGFSAAVSRTVANLDGEMADEFALALGEMRAGASRSEALGGIAERVHLPEVRSFVVAMRQADQFGISVSSVLRNQAEDMRSRRQLAAQEKAMKAPVKMLIPMVFCIFPPMFIVTIGPAGIQLANGF